MTNQNWEKQLKFIVPDYTQRNKVIKFIKEFKKAWKISAKKSTKQKSLSL